MTIPNREEPPMTQKCDYCGEPGHQWPAHPEARDNVAEWAREMEREANR